MHDKKGYGVGLNLEADTKYASTGVATQFTMNALSLNFRKIAREKSEKCFL